MNIRRWGLAQSVVALFILSAVAFVPVLAQQQGQKVDKKAEKAQQFDIQSIVSATNAAMAGETIIAATRTRITSAFIGPSFQFLARFIRTKTL